jgi:hypothetical protein
MAGSDEVMLRDGIGVTSKLSARTTVHASADAQSIIIAAGTAITERQSRTEKDINSPHVRDEARAALHRQMANRLGADAEAHHDAQVRGQVPECRMNANTS